MWCLPPIIYCINHLLGCHGEIHKHRHVFVKKYSIKGRIYPVVQIEPLSMKIEHDLIAQEMLNRGYKHNSPYELPDLSGYGIEEINAKVDREASLNDLLNRCEKCRLRYDKFKHLFKYPLFNR